MRLAVLAAALIVLWLSREGQLPVAEASVVDSARAALNGVRVKDGDTIERGGEDIRLIGIDAPELRQRCSDDAGRDWDCGKAAKAALGRLAAGRDLSCVEEGRDRYGRTLASCSVGGEDVGGAMVRNGWALNEPFGGPSRYRSEELDARAGRLGMWRGSFMRPSDFRVAARRS